MSETPLPPTATPPEAPATVSPPAPTAASGESARAAGGPLAGGDLLAPGKPLLNPLQNNGPPPSSTIVEPPKSPMPADPASAVASPGVAPSQSAAAPAPEANASVPGLSTSGADQPPLPTDAPVPPSPQPPKDEEPPILPPGAIPSAVPTPTVILTEEQAMGSSGSGAVADASTTAAVQASPAPPPPASPAPPPPATPAVEPAAVQPPTVSVPAPTATAFPAADADGMDVDADADAQGEDDEAPIQSAADTGSLKRAGDDLEGREEKRSREGQPGASGPAAPVPPASYPSYVPGTRHPEYTPARYDENLPSSPLTQAQHKHLLSTVRALKKNPFAFAFLAPVDPVLLNIPHYPSVVTSPMDLGTVETKLIVSDPRGPPKDKSKAKNWDPSKGQYNSVRDVARDVRQIWENTRMFNGPNHDVSLNANKLDAIFEKALKSLPADRPPPAAAMPSPAASGSAQPPARRPSISQPPVIRRSSDGTEARPKREIHPPPSKDVGYAETSRKPKRRSDPQLAFVAKQFRALENKQYEAITAPFFYPIGDIIANIPLYSEVIKKPIDLNIIRQRFADAEYEDIAQVQADMELVWTNAQKYNRPGDQYHTAAGQLKQLWQDRMKGMPPKEVPRQESEDPLAEEFEESDGEDSTAIKSLEAQIEFLQKQVEALRAKRAAKRNGPAPAKGSKAKGGAAAARRQSVSKAAGPSAGASNGYGDGQPQAKRPRKSKDAPSTSYRDDDESEEEAQTAITSLTQQQKQQLADIIPTTDGETLQVALRIIQETMNLPADAEIELDIDSLPTSTAVKLYKLVVLRQGRGKTGRSRGGHKKNGPGRKGPGSRKRMNEQEEADRIRRMEEQLQSFDAGARGSFGGGGAGGGAAAGQGYDDSDESSDEGESDDE